MIREAFIMTPGYPWNKPCLDKLSCHTMRKWEKNIKYHQQNSAVVIEYFSSGACKVKYSMLPHQDWSKRRYNINSLQQNIFDMVWILHDCMTHNPQQRTHFKYLALLLVCS